MQNNIHRSSGPYIPRLVWNTCGFCEIFIDSHQAIHGAVNTRNTRIN